MKTLLNWQKNETRTRLSAATDIVDGAARVMDPLFDGINTGKHWCGKSEGLTTIPW
jgi:hypothetical protein